MPQLNPIARPDHTYSRLRFLGGVGLCVLAAVAFIATPLPAEAAPVIESEPMRAELLKEGPAASHDELIMLILSLAVAIEIWVNFGFIRRAPRPVLLLCSFGLFVLGAFLTVAEGFFFEGVLNYLEHLAYMAGMIALAVWCGWGFGAKRREDS